MSKKSSTLVVAGSEFSVVESDLSCIGAGTRFEVFYAGNEDGVPVISGQKAGGVYSGRMRGITRSGENLAETISEILSSFFSLCGKGF